jgi:subtilisin family serine protease
MSTRNNPTARRFGAKTRWLVLLTSLAAGVALLPMPSAKSAARGPAGRQLTDRGELKQYTASQMEGAQLGVDEFLQLSKAKASYGLSGKGLTVAVIDSGLKTDHDDFIDRVLTQRNFTDVGTPDTVTDVDGHGTHVAGILVAGGVNNPGIAPNARVIPLKVCGKGVTRDNYESIAEALQWVIDNRVTHTITVVNISMGDRGNYQSADEITDPAFLTIAKKVKELRAANVPVVVAAGNYYHRYNSKDMTQPPPRQGMNFPAILPDTVSVGAVFDSDGEPLLGEGEMPPPKKLYNGGSQGYCLKFVRNRVCPFSQRLHPNVSPSCYTDIFAPGAEILSTGIKSKKGQSLDADGTSQAGTILLMQEHHQRLTGKQPTVNDLERWLRLGGQDAPDNPHNDDSVHQTTAVFRRLHALGSLSLLNSELKSAQLSGSPQ